MKTNVASYEQLQVFFYMQEAWYSSNTRNLLFISLRLNGVNPILKTNNDSHGNWGGEW
jgi:hypothetical protein